MIRNVFIVTALLACTSVALAEPSKDKGFYLAGAYGRSICDEGGSFGNFGDDEDNSYHIALGIQTDVYVWDNNNDWESSVGATQLSLQVMF